MLRISEWGDITALSCRREHLRGQRLEQRAELRYSVWQHLRGVAIFGPPTASPVYTRTATWHLQAATRRNLTLIAAAKDNGESDNGVGQTVGG